MSKNNRGFFAQQCTKLSGSRKKFSEFKNKKDSDKYDKEMSTKSN
jgi:hypothetical protein